MALSQTSVIKLYNTVIEDVIANVRDAFLDDGVDEQVLQEMKQVWTNKLMSSKAVEITVDPLEPQQPAVLSNSKSNGTKSKAKSAQAQAAAAAAAEAKAAAQSTASSTTTNASTNANSGGGGGSGGMASGSSAMNSAGAKSIPAGLVPTSNSQVPMLAQQQQQQHHHQQSNQSHLMAASSSHPPPLAPQQQRQPIQQQHHPQHQQQQQSASSQQQQQAPPQQGTQAAVAGLHPSKIVPIQITLPPQPGVQNSEPRVLTIQVPASALQENQLHQVLTGPIITSIMSLPPQLASSVLQQHVNNVLQNNAMPAMQLQQRQQMDGANDSSDDEGSDVSDDALDGDDDDDLDKEDDEEIDGEGGAEEEPLNSDDDVSEEEQADMFETENVIVCQYDKITRSRNKWKFYLKDGIMNINGKDYVFQKSNGDAEW